MSANSLTKAIINYLNYTGYNVWRNNSMGVYDAKKQVYRKNPSQKNGIADVIGFRKSDGKHIEVEVKLGKDKISDDQALHHEDLKKGHCIIIVAKTFDQFEKEIKQFN